MNAGLRSGGRILRHIFTCGLLGTLCGQVGAQTSVVYDNVGPTGLDPAGASPASQVDPAFPFEAGAADDFILPESPLCRWNVSGVRWTCKHWGVGEPAAVGSFRVMIWDDEDGLPQSGLGILPDPGLAIASYTTSASMSTSDSAPDAYDFEATFPQPIELMPGRRYWIQIQAVAEYPPQWGMHITHGRTGLGPLQYFDLLTMPAWMSVPDDGDLAFELLGSPTTANCDDGNACTVESCVQGECVSIPLACEDDDACTVDSCDPQSGCTHASKDCADEDSCTTDLCADGSCLHIGPPDFDGDSDIDVADYAVMASCSMDSASNDKCPCADLSGDGRVDMKDMALMQQVHTGSK